MNQLQDQISCYKSGKVRNCVNMLQDLEHKIRDTKSQRDGLTDDLEFKLLKIYEVLQHE